MLLLHWKGSEGLQTVNFFQYKTIFGILIKIDMKRLSQK